MFQISSRPAIYMMCFAFESISAMEDTLDNFRQEEVPHNTLSRCELKDWLKLNSSTRPNLPDIAKRLQVVEKQ